MAFKIISVILALAALAFFLTRAFRGQPGAVARRPAPARAAVTDLVACPHCGAYRPAKGLCRCREAPTP